MMKKLNNIKSWLIIQFIVLILFICCKTQHTNSICENLNIFKDFKPPLSLEQNKKNMMIWEQFMALDTLALDYLISLKDERKSYICDSIHIGYNDLRNNQLGCVWPNYISIRISGLYLISALYYNQYNYASQMILYSPSNLFIDNNQIYRNRTKLPLCFNDDLEIEKAWQYILVWRKSVRGKTMADIRRLHLNPLENTGFYWIGQKDTILNNLQLLTKKNSNTQWE